MMCIWTDLKVLNFNFAHRDFRRASKKKIFSCKKKIFFSQKFLMVITDTRSWSRKLLSHIVLQFNGLSICKKPIMMVLFLS